MNFPLCYFHLIFVSIWQLISKQDKISSPLGAQLFDFCESDLFPETLQNSEVASSFNCCYEDQSSYQTHPSITADMNNYTNSLENELNPVSPTKPPVISATNNNMSIIFDPTEDQLDNDISASTDFTTPNFSIPQYLNHQESLNISSLNNNQLSLGDMADHQYDGTQQMGPVSLLGPQMQTVYDQDDCGMPSVRSYIQMRNSIDPMITQYLPSSMNAPFLAENSRILGGGGLMLGNGITHQELDFQGNNGLFQRVFNSDFQGLSSESQHVVHGGTCGTTPLGSEISSLDDPTFNVGKLSVEERKRKIHRYMKKRNERNFSKKIKYACRKTLADSRPRVRGRFAKSDEQGGEINATNNNGSNHEYDDTNEDVSLYSNPVPDHQRKVGVKEKEDMDSADIFAQINSFKYSYPIQSWI